MKRIFVFSCLCLMSTLCGDLFAHGGAAVVVARPLLFPRVAIRRAAVVAAPQAIVVQRQAVIAVQSQYYVQPQAVILQRSAAVVVQPQVQALQTPCASSLFFSY